MTFTIITPSYNMLPYLKLCHQSITDQNKVQFEHIVMDGNSTDGTQNWLQDQQLIHKSEPDSGMYDAINKGFAMASGDIIAYLNCDEQYLPGTLAAVDSYFESHPEVDILFGHALITNPDGMLICFRKAYQPRKHFIMASHLYTLSCTMFFRRKIVDQGIAFDTNYQSIGDMKFVLDLLMKGYKATYLNQYLSIFTWTGNNLSADERSMVEMEKIKKTFPGWVTKFEKPINWLRWIEKLISGAYFSTPTLSYEIYTQGSPKERTAFTHQNPDHKWPN